MAIKIDGDINQYIKLVGRSDKTVEKDVQHIINISGDTPVIDEIDKDLDNTKYALYFKQAKNGIPVRQAMMMAVLGKDKEFFL